MRAPGLEPGKELPPVGFSSELRLSPPAIIAVCLLDSVFTMTYFGK